MYARKLKPVLATLLVAGSLVGMGAHAEGLYAGGSLGSQSYPDTLNGNPTSGSAVGAKVYGVVGREDGYTARYADIAICIPIIEEPLITPMSEAFQSLVWHALVSHPTLQRNATKW